MNCMMHGSKVTQSQTLFTKVSIINKVVSGFVPGAKNTNIFSFSAVWFSVLNQCFGPWNCINHETKRHKYEKSA